MLQPSSGLLNLVPVDFCSSAIVNLGQNWKKNSGKVFHVVNPNGSIDWVQIIDHVRSFGYKIHELDFPDWKKNLTEQIEVTRLLENEPQILTESRESLSTMKHFFGGVEPPVFSGSYDCSALSEALNITTKHIEEKCPKINKKIIHCYLQHFVKAKLIPAQE